MNDRFSSKTSSSGLVSASCRHRILNVEHVKLATSEAGNHNVLVVIIQQIVTLSKYGHDALDICHP